MLEYQLDGFSRRARERHQMLLAEVEQERLRGPGVAAKRPTQAGTGQHGVGPFAFMRQLGTWARTRSFSPEIRMTLRHA